MSDEVMDVCRTRKTFTCRITWQEFEYDKFTSCCVRAREDKPHYGDMPHLRIEIYPTHPNRPMDMVHILGYVEDLCGTLRRVERLQDLSIVFLENEVASWSQHGRAKEPMTLQPYPRHDDGFSDIGYIFDHFNTLTNIAKVTMHLPDSLACDEEIHDDRKVIETRMKATCDAHLALTMETRNETKDLTAEAGPRLKEATGQLSRAIIEAICEYGLRTISIEDLAHLKTVWPYTDALSDRHYFPDHKYTGVAPTISPVESSRQPCICLRKAPRIENERRIALARAITNPKWYMCPRLRHNVTDILLLMINYEV